MKFLKNHFDTVEIHATGTAVTNAISSANKLVDSGLTSLARFKTVSCNSFPKVIFKLSKTPDFDTIYAEIQLRNSERKAAFALKKNSSEVSPSSLSDEPK